MKLPRAGVLFLLVTAGGSTLLPSRAGSWQRTLPEISGMLGEVGESLDVAVLGYDVFVAVGSRAFIVLELGGSNGQEAWRYEIGPGSTVAAAVDPVLDVVAAGVRFTADGMPLTVVKLSGATGGELW